MADKKTNKTVEKLGFGRVKNGSADEKDMAQIREILFGEQNRQSANRMARIESMLSAQDTALRELLESRIDRAVKELLAELGSLGKHQATELDAVDAELRALLKKTDERLTLMDSDLQDARHQADHSLAEHTRSLDQLRQDSVERTQLAALFEGLARQLRGTPEK